MVEPQSRLSKAFGSGFGGSSGAGAGGAQKKLSPSPQPQTQPKNIGGGSAGAGAGAGGVKQITIQMPSISLRIDDHFKAKLPFFFLMLLLFSFSLVLLEKSNFHTIDVVDVGRIQYNLSKLWSVSFMLFLLLYSFALALAMFYGFGQNWGSFVLPAFACVIVALVAGSFYSGGYLLAFVALALTVAAASLIASFRTQVKFSSIYSTASSALLILVVLSFFVAFNQISANKDVYIDAFISSGVTTSVAQMQGASLGSVLTPQLIASSINKQQVESVITEKRVRSYLDESPAFVLLNASTKDALVSSVRVKLVNDFYASLQNDLPVLLSNVKLGGGSSSSGGSVAAMKQALGQTPAFIAFYNNFSLLAAVFIASLVSVFAFFMKIVSTLLCWLLAKL